VRGKLWPEAVPRPLRVRYSRIQREVDRLLVQYDVKHPPVDIEKIAKDAGAVISYEEMKDELCGFFLPGKREFVIGVNSSHPRTRRRFTIAHELGHAILHQFDEVHIDRSFKFRSPVSAKAVDIEEIEANTFAAWILMPERFLQSEIRNFGVDLEDTSRIQALSDAYQVSQQSMSFRLLNTLSRYPFRR